MNDEFLLDFYFFIHNSKRPLGGLTIRNLFLISTNGTISLTNGINTRNKAEEIKKYKILVKTNSIPKLKKEEFHLLELVNLEVKTLENNELKIIGKVINLENEKNNLLVIELFKNQKKVLIPFVKEIVPLVDIKNKFLIINPPNGLLEL